MKRTHWHLVNMCVAAFLMNGNTVRTLPFIQSVLEKSSNNSDAIEQPHSSKFINYMKRDKKKKYLIHANRKLDTIV